MHGRNTVLFVKQQEKGSSVEKTRPRERASITTPVWFKAPGTINKELINLLKPLGVPGQERYTLSLSTEGNGINVVLDGWLGTLGRGTQTIYHTYVKRQPKDFMYVTPISGVQEPDIYHGESLYFVKQNLLDLLEGKRLVVYGAHNHLPYLGITQQDLDIKDIELVDIRRVPKWENCKLEDFDRYFYCNRKLKEFDREILSPHNGSNPERKARLQLLIYRKIVTLMNLFGELPPGGEIKERGKSLDDWIKTKKRL